VALQDQLAGVLRRKGQRPTPQRLMILSVLAERGGHLTAETIHEVIRDSYPTINLSTVYRTLETLRDHGIVSETDLGQGRRQFEMLGQRHHHLVCLRCGHLDDLHAAALAPLEAQLRADHGFHARLDHMAIFGLCRQCAATEAAADEAPGR
jgi:Fur family transcriptional regulator, ferric uptake regulator